jgi:hypothetical protein
MSTPFNNIYLIRSYSHFLEKLSEQILTPCAQSQGSAFVEESSQQKNEKNPLPRLWFRGQASHVWGLQPGLCRKVKVTNPALGWTNQNWLEFCSEEDKRIRSFKVHNYHNFPYSRPESTYLWLCPMQHYGLRTRLLDWTESAEVAFFFALETYINEINQKPNTQQVFLRNGHFISIDMSKTFPSVWVLNPNAMLKALNYRNPNSIPDLYNEPTGYFDRRLPTPVLAPYNNDRIKMQTGTFVIYPNKKIHHQGVFSQFPFLENLDNANDFLWQFIIIHPMESYQEIKSIGSKMSIYYPEMVEINKDIENEL